MVRKRFLAQKQRRLGAAAGELEEKIECSAAAQRALALGKTRSRLASRTTLKLLLFDRQSEKATLKDLFDKVEAFGVFTRGACSKWLELGRCREVLLKRKGEGSVEWTIFMNAPKAQKALACVSIERRPRSVGSFTSCSSLPTSTTGCALRTSTRARSVPAPPHEAGSARGLFA